MAQGRETHHGAEHPASARRPRLLGPGDVEPAAALLTRAFRDDPSKLALFPDEPERERVIALAAPLRLRAAIPYGTAYAVEIDDALAGVALWHPPNAKPSAVAPVATLLRALFAPGRRAFPLVSHVARMLWRDRQALQRIAAGRTAVAREARRRPTWYLALLGTDPRFRGRGAARQLLEHVLKRCDEDGVAAWTEATNTGNVSMYERFGFVTVAHLRGGDAIPDLWLLRREPQPGHAQEQEE